MKRFLAALDCETDPFKWMRVPKPFIWGLYSEEGYITFTKIDELIAYVRRTPLIIYAHNGGKFDFLMGIFDNLEEGTPLKIINGRLSEFRLGKSVFRDSMLIFPMGLAKYKKEKVEYWKFEAEFRDKYMDEIKVYLRSDCENLFNLVKAFRDQYGNKLTLASSAMSFWRQTSEMEPPKSSDTYFKTYSPYYFGGRVECFKKGIFRGNINVYDINSAYPFAMLSQHPFGCNPIRLGKLPDSGVDRCLLTVEAPAKGYFPFKEKTGTSFPNDDTIRTFQITGWEFKTAKEIDPQYPVAIKEVHYFPDTINFAEYIQHFYAIKKHAEKNSTEYLFAKLMMNSLYGKFGANPDNYRRFTICKPKNIELMQETTDFTLCDIVYPWALMEAPLQEASRRFYDVALAASITGFVRAYLLSHLFRSDKPYYCDTDSIHVENLQCETGQELGQWNVEFTGDKAAYAGKKLYALVNSGKYGKDAEGKETGVKIASKGVRLDSNQIFRVAGGETVTWRSDAPTISVKSGIHFQERRVRMT